MIKSKRAYFVAVGLILLLAGFLRLYKLGSLPGGLYWDEVAIGYDAFSISQTGKDHTGSIPVTFLKSFGDFKNPLYVYLTSGVIKLTGQLNEVSVRLVSSLSGVMTVLAMMILTLAWFKDRNISILSGLLLAISPWAVMMSRAGFEANLFLGLIAWAVVFFSWFVENGRLKQLSLSIGLFGLSLYSYHSAKITTPLILLTLLIVFKKKLLKLKAKLVIPLLVLFVFGVPFANPETLKTTFFRAGGVVSVNQERVNTGAEELLRDKYPQVNRFFHDKRSIRAKSYLSNYVKNLSFDFLFFEGDSNTRHSVVGFGQMYLFELLTVLIGAYWLALKHKNGLAKKILLTILLVAPIPSAISVKAPHALRSILLLVPLSVLSALGLRYIWVKIRSKILKGLLLVVVLFQVLNFFHQYFYHYNYNNSASWQQGYKEVIGYLKEVGVEDKRVVFTNEQSQALWYLAYYWPFEPSEFQEQAEVSYGEDGKFWETVGVFDNFEVKNDLNWNDYVGESDVILVDGANRLPENMIKKSFYYPDQTVVFEVTKTSDWK